MKLQIITIGEPKLHYAQEGWDEYLRRLRRYHNVRTIHLADKFQHDSAKLKQAMGTSYAVALAIKGDTTFTSRQLAGFLEARATEGREVSFLVGGPEGLPAEILAHCQINWSFSDLTLPHDLAMVVLAEALYRASTINAHHPYHRE